jgi:hypothetical protein
MFYVRAGMLYVGRIVGGLAGGICCVVAPSYIGTYRQSLFLLTTNQKE